MFYSSCREESSVCDSSPSSSFQSMLPLSFGVWGVRRDFFLFYLTVFCVRVACFRGAWKDFFDIKRKMETREEKNKRGNIVLERKRKFFTFCGWMGLQIDWCSCVVTIVMFVMILFYVWRVLMCVGGFGFGVILFRKKTPHLPNNPKNKSIFLSLYLGRGSLPILYTKTVIGMHELK